MIRIAVVGAGLIGARHVEAVGASRTARLNAIVDPAPQARELAAKAGVGWFADLDAMISGDRPDGVILATPNRHHVEGALACIAAALPVLVEKPLASELGAARALVEAAETAGVPLLTGHHRRHNPIVAAARTAIEGGDIGRPVTANAMVWLCKPESYFETAWRRAAGAGPVYLNLSHDVDLLRHLLGEITGVTAHESRAIRGHEVEDTAVVLLRYAMYGWLLPGKGCEMFLTSWSEAAMYPASRCVCRCDARHDGVCRDRGPTQWPALRRAWRDTG